MTEAFMRKGHIQQCKQAMIMTDKNKFVNEGLECFTCSSLCSAHEKTPATLMTQSKLFACKTLCYKWLLKFQQAAAKLMARNKNIKEIQDAFQGESRARRFLEIEIRRKDAEFRTSYQQIEQSNLISWFLY